MSVPCGTLVAMPDAAPKTDFTKTLDSYQARAGRFRVLDIPPRQYLMADGHGDRRSAVLGADLLKVAGSHPWVVAWSAEHHEPPEEWTVPQPVGELLSAADH